MLVACREEAFIPEAPEVPEVAETTLTFTSDRPGFSSETKTAWDSENSAIVWSGGDRILIGPQHPANSGRGADGILVVVGRGAIRI